MMSKTSREYLEEQIEMLLGTHTRKDKLALVGLSKLLITSLEDELAGDNAPEPVILTTNDELHGLVPGARVVDEHTGVRYSLRRLPGDHWLFVTRFQKDYKEIEINDMSFPLTLTRDGPSGRTQIRTN